MEVEIFANLFLDKVMLIHQISGSSMLVMGLSQHAEY